MSCGQAKLIAGTVNNAPASYADIAIDPNSVKFPESESETGATVLIVNAPVEPKFQAKTEQVMCNMLQRAIARAVENGFNTVRFVDVSPNPTPQMVQTLQQLSGEQKDIRVEFLGTASLKEGMKLLTQPSDIVLGVRCAETVGVIDFLASRSSAMSATGYAYASYIPETGGFDRRNLPLVQKNVEVASIKV
jgi:hypothetical protein